MHRPTRSVGAWRSVPLAVVVALAVAGCAGPAAPRALHDAHAAVERARSAPRVRALAPAELDLAESALEQVWAAARAGAPRAQVEHLAYVASQRAAFAEARAAAAVARSETRLLRRALAQAAIETSLEDQQSRMLSRQDRDPPAPREEDQRERLSVDTDQAVPAVEPDAMTADLETMPQEITLRIARLPFEDAEPTEEALEKIAALAEQLLREPSRRLLIEAEFDLPDPEARTLMERRVEVVRALFLERGVAPARVVVHATGDGPPNAPLVDPTG